MKIPFIRQKYKTFHICRVNWQRSRNPYLIIAEQFDYSYESEFFIIYFIENYLLLFFFGMACTLFLLILSLTGHGGHEYKDEQFCTASQPSSGIIRVEKK